MTNHPSSGRSGFTLTEALVALSITVMAGSALLLGVESSIQTTDESMEQTVAAGLAQQAIDEVLGNRYAAPGSGAHQTGLGPNSWEAAGEGRERFNDTDDYNGFVANPPVDIWGDTLGQGDGTGSLRHPSFRVNIERFGRWRREIDVFYVDETDQSVRLPSGSTSDFRAVEVRVILESSDGTEREMYRLRRVYSYVNVP